MTAAVAQLDRRVSHVVATRGGVRPIEQGEGDSFVAAFGRASDAVTAALDLQRAPLAPIRLRIGLHTGEVQLRDEGNYIGPTINRTARLRDLAHGGQTVLSRAAEDMVVDRLPDGAWLTDLGTYPLRDLPRPERVVQLCHRDLRNDFPPLRTPKSVGAHSLPVQLTSFVGREAEIHEVRRLLADNRLVTLTGAGGAGKTRLAVEIAARIAAEFSDGVWYVDLAPITDPDVVPIAVARALGLPDQPGRSTMDTLLRFVRDRQMLVVLDNCEHLLDASADLVVTLLDAAAGLTLLTTSRELIGVGGEVTWRVPSLSLSDEAVELFADRARRARPDFEIRNDNAAAVTELCRRLDGLPLAIELAAARVRALSLADILDGLRDRFRLLTGGARTAVPRQQTLRASVDWSHALLTEPERALFRRLAVFLGGFDLEAAQAVAGGGDVERYQVLDQLTLLVDKSLVVAEDTAGRMRYGLLETVRQYALEKLGESGEANAVRARHRDHYTALAALLDTPGRADYERRLEQAEIEIDNLRAAFAWSRENSDVELASALASSLQPLWQARGRLREGLVWFDAALAGLDTRHPGMAPAVWARALTACGYTAIIQKAEVAGQYFAEALGLARALGDRWRLSQILASQARGAIVLGDPIAAGAAGQEGCDLADAIGDWWTSRQCRWCLGMAQLFQGDLATAAAQFGLLAAGAEAAHDGFFAAYGLAFHGIAIAYQGETGAARAVADAALDAADELGGIPTGMAYLALSCAALAAGDPAAALDATESAWQYMSVVPAMAAVQRSFMAQAALAGGDLIAGRRWATEAVETSTGWYLMVALTTRALVALAQGEPDQAERDAHEALACAAEVDVYLGISDTLECLAALAGDACSHREAARLFGAAHAARQCMGAVRFKVWDAGYETSVAAVRDALGDKDFDSAWVEGAALSAKEAIAYAQRGRGERKRPTSGWGSLTPTEREVVRLVSEGLPNKDIAARLFISSRTVESHLTHVYTKLGLTSRVQLAHEAARHA